MDKSGQYVEKNEQYFLEHENITSQTVSEIEKMKKYQLLEAKLHRYNGQ